MDPKIKELKEKIAELEKEVHMSRKEKSKAKKIETYVPEKILISWQSLARIYIQRDKAWFLKVAIVALLFILYFAFLQDFIVILVVCVAVLISFLLGTIPPHKVTHKITNKGIFSIDQLYKWKDLKTFYIAEKSGYRILYVFTKIPLSTRLVILIHRKDEKNIVKLLASHLKYHELEDKQGWLSKMTYGESVQPDNYHNLLLKNEKKPKKKFQKQ